MICMRLPARHMAAILAAFTVITTTSQPRRAADAPMVKIENFAFTPPVLTVKPGTESLSRALETAIADGYGECFWPGMPGGQYWWIFRATTRRSRRR